MEVEEDFENSGRESRGRWNERAAKAAEDISNNRASFLVVLNDPFIKSFYACRLPPRFLWGLARAFHHANRWPGYSLVV